MTDLIRYNKKSISDIWRVILLEEICFPSVFSVFSECFLLIYRNVLELKYDLTMMTFNSSADTR